MKHDQHSQLVSRIKETLNTDIRELHPETLRRLQEARYQALSGSPPSKTFWIPALGMVAVCVLAISVFFGRIQEIPKDSQIHVQAEEKIQILIMADGMDLYEDLDFYAWLAEENQPG